ncbi:VOC family protein [Halomarina halobia]|uniref:VOC family protein n=1 Tax=Halomarina halobia TaxID=3033386 RepID=A0ABD6A595_9EURY|nr:fosmidomycin resistance protein [Halomarina sp. PSR21]
MLSSLRWLALEVKYLDPAGEFYERHLDLPLAEQREAELVFDAGGTDLVLRRPSGVPRGGLHVHYAFATPPDRYDDWWERLSRRFDLTEHRFGSARSLYFYDLEGNCVEIGQRGEGDRDIAGIFEVVLEVEDLDRAEAFYTTLGLDVTNRGAERRRVRLTTGAFDLELWEPHLGLADARGGVHADVGIEAEDPTAAAERVGGQACDVEPLAEGVRVRDPDGHYVTLVP